MMQWLTRIGEFQKTHMPGLDWTIPLFTLTIMLGLALEPWLTWRSLGSAEDFWLTDHEDYDVFLFERVWEFREEAWFCRVVAQWIFELCFMSFWKLTCCMSPSFNTSWWQWHCDTYSGNLQDSSDMKWSSCLKGYGIPVYRYTFCFLTFWNTNGFCLDPDPSSGLWR